MADSENSRTLPSNRYRNLLLDTERLLSDLEATKCGTKRGGANDALTKWAAWSLAHSDYSRLCRIQQRLEREPSRNARGLPMEPLVSYPDSAEHIEAPEATEGPRELDAFRNTSSSDADLVALRYQGKSVDYNRAKAAEDASSAREQWFAAELWSVSVGSPVSALAKLHCVLEQGQPAPDSAEFPWPQIRSAIADLLTSISPGLAALPNQSEGRSSAGISCRASRPASVSARPTGDSQHELAQILKHIDKPIPYPQSARERKRNNPAHSGSLPFAEYLTI